LLNNADSPVFTWPVETLPATLARKTRRIYDRVAPVYALSSALFHARAHSQLLESCEIEEGMRVLEVATGSGEMFRRLVRANRSGCTMGVDISPNMAARTQRLARNRYPDSTAHCQAVDARYMPFREASFDLVVCCYLLELMAGNDIERTLSEFNRVLRHGGQLALVVIGENTAFFNRLYRIAGSIAPAFWGRQVERAVPNLIESFRFSITHEHEVRQSGYPSRVLVARKR